MTQLTGDQMSVLKYLAESDPVDEIGSSVKTFRVQDDVGIPFVALILDSLAMMGLAEYYGGEEIFSERWWGITPSGREAVR